MSEHALQINVLTLGGTCNCHIWFHSLLSCLAEECSTYSSCLMRSATRYANLTENMTFLFSFQISLSRLAVVPKLMCCISHTVLGMNVLESNCRCHYLVAGLKRSHTLMFLSASGLSCGGCGSHLWSSILMLLPSPTFHTVAARIRSLDSSKLLHTNEGLFPILASINEQLGK